MALGGDELLRAQSTACQRRGWEDGVTAAIRGCLNFC